MENGQNRIHNLSDEFQKSAIENLIGNPQKPYYKFEDTLGNRTLRYARGVVMKSACVTCHNSHPESRKIDWKVGDLRGVVEVAIPMGSQWNFIRDGLLGNMLVMLIITIILLSVLALVIKGLRGSLATVKVYAHEIEETNTALTRFVPQEFLQILKKPRIVDVSLGDHIEREMTVIFTDIRSFTTLSEKNVSPGNLPVY